MTTATIIAALAGLTVGFLAGLAFVLWLARETADAYPDDRS